MTALEATLRDVTRALDAMGRKWAVVGGLAVSARAEPRFTRDIDLAVAVSDDADSEGLVLRLSQKGYQVLASVEHEGTGRLATIRLVAPPVRKRATGVVVDLLFASSGIEPEIVDQAGELEVLPGLTLPVARTPHLIATKLLARDDVRRPQDIADLRALLPEANPADLKCVGQLLALITQRRCNRDRNLKALWAALRKEERERRRRDR